MYLDEKDTRNQKKNNNRTSSRIQQKRFLNIVLRQNILKLIRLFLTLRWHGIKWLGVARVEMVSFFIIYLHLMRHAVSNE